ncbi:MAG: HEAT repeat domain-containing protein [Candidatus Brocadiia bacterium]
MGKFPIFIILFLIGLTVFGAASQDFTEYLNKGIDGLISQLGDEQWEIREKASEELSRLGMLARPGLEKALSNGDAEIRERAAQLIALNKWREPFTKRMDKFIGQLKNKNFSDKALVNDMVYFLSRDESSPILIDILKDNSQPPDVRYSVATALRNVANVNFKSINNDIIQLYGKDKDENMRAALIWLMSKGGKDEKVMPVLLSALNEPSHQIKQAALYTLAEIGDNTILPEILKMLKGADSNIKSTVLYALNRFRDESVTKELVRVMKEDSSINIRTQAMGMLANYADPKLIPEFLAILKNDKDPYVQQTVLGSLGRYRNEKTIAPVLINMYKTAHTAVQPNILAAIQSVGDKDSIPLLIEILSQETDYNSFHAILNTVQALAANQKFTPVTIPQNVKDDVITKAKEWWDKNK